MEFIKKLLGMGSSKPFKIQDGSGKKRIGITASNMNELKKKALGKLNIGVIDSIVLEDGTIIDDDQYFQTLPPQSVVIVLKPGERWEGFVSYLKLASTKIIDNATSRKKTTERIQELLVNPNSPELALIMEYISVQHSNIDAESKDEDPEWFDGLSNSIKSKSQAMRESAKGRVRGYLFKSKEYIEKVELSKGGQKLMARIIDNFKTRLLEENYYGDYFDRGSEHGKRKLCSVDGWFRCQGEFDEFNCNKSHIINPYASRETRILFSTWNLDHRIEKSREILPKLVNAVTNCPVNKSVNWQYFYNLLFTLENLKLVDIRCHRKDKHSSCVVDSKKVYLNDKG